MVASLEDVEKIKDMMPSFVEFNIDLEGENALPEVRKPWKDSPYKSNTSWYGIVSGFQIFWLATAVRNGLYNKTVCVCVCACKQNFTKIVCMFYKTILNIYMQCIDIFSSVSVFKTCW